VHTWNLDSPSGGIGIILKGPGYTQNRLIGCYLDYNSLIIEAPEHATVTDGFFLCGANIVIKASKEFPKIDGLVISNNQFDACKNDTIILDESETPFTSIIDTEIYGNMFSGGYTVKSTRAEAQMYKKNSTMWMFDFSDRLLFSSIATVKYSIQLDSGFCRHVSRPPKGKTVVIETDEPVDALVVVEVEQSVPSHPWKPPSRK
jgi:hypothetical protein